MSRRVLLLLLRWFARFTRIKYTSHRKHTRDSMSSKYLPYGGRSHRVRIDKVEDFLRGCTKILFDDSKCYRIGECAYLVLGGKKRKRERM